MSSTSTSLQIAAYAIKHLIQSVNNSIHERQVLNLLDTYILHHSKNLVLTLYNTFDMKHQCSRLVSQEQQPVRMKIDSLAVGQIKKEQNQEGTNNTIEYVITDNEWKRSETKSRQTIKSDHKFNTTSKTIGTKVIPLDLSKIENQIRAKPILRQSPPPRQTIGSQKVKKSQRAAQNNLSQFTYQYDGKILPISSIKSSIDIPKATQKISTISIEAKTNRISEVGIIKTRRSLCKQPSKIQSNPLIGSQPNSVIPLFSEKQKQQLKLLTLKQYSETIGGKFKKSANAIRLQYGNEFSYDIVQPQKVLDGKQKKAAFVEHNRSNSQRNQHQKIKLVLPKIKGKLIGDNVSNKLR